MIRSLCLFLVLACAGTTHAADRPNILWLSCEDISAHLGCYGDPHAITPHLDQLVREGARYTHAFTTAGVCAPSRSAIITGMYQTALGTQHMRGSAKLPEGIRPFPLDEIDAQARPVLDDMKAALQPRKDLYAGDKYVVRVINRALNELEGTQRTVR